jgi:hypothetical protein
VTGVWREAEHHTTGSANWRKIKWKKAEGGGDRHQKERKRVQGDAGTDLVCSCDPCLLEWRVFLASSRCCYMAGRPFPPSRLCFVPRQGQTPFLLRDAWIYCDCDRLIGPASLGPGKTCRPGRLVIYNVFSWIYNEGWNATTTVSIILR